MHEPIPGREGELADPRVPHHREKGVDAEEEVGRLRSLDVDQREDESALDVCAYEALKRNFANAVSLARLQNCNLFLIQLMSK